MVKIKSADLGNKAGFTRPSLTYTSIDYYHMLTDMYLLQVSVEDHWEAQDIPSLS